MTTLAWARHYVAGGFSIVPLHHPVGDRCSCGRWPCGTDNKSCGKHPTVSDWQKRGVMTAEEADRFWTANPDANIGLRMGGPSRHVAIDIDGSTGRASLTALERELGALPPTVTTRSGRADGGEHRIFRVPPDLDIEAISNTKLDPGIDVKCTGGQVVAPPSLHYTGKRYESGNALVPADLPQAWYDRLPKRPRPAEATDTPSPNPQRAAQAVAYAATMAPAIEGQGGSTATFVACMKVVRGFDLTEDEAFVVLIPWNASCVPPWDEYGLRRKISEANEKGNMPRGALLADTPSAASFDVLEASDIFAPLPDIDYLIQALGVTQGAPLLVAGYGYSGKTAAAQQLAIDLTREATTGMWMTPRPVWGLFPAARRAKVLHVDFEQGGRLTRRRYQRLAKAAGLDPRELEGWLRLVTLPELYLNQLAGLAALERLCEGMDVVIVDSFRAANPGLDENSSEAREPLDALNRISEKQGTVGVVIHHARKPSQDKPGGAKMSIRGSGAIFDGSASVLVFDGEKDQPKRISHEKERNSGITLDDFELVIEDHEGGLRVRAAGIVVPTAEEKLDAQTKADIEAIRAYLVKHVYFRNRAELQVALNVRTGRIGVAMSAMMRAGELVNDGTHNRPSYHLTGAAGVNGAAAPATSAT